MNAAAGLARGENGCSSCTPTRNSPPAGSTSLRQASDQNRWNRIGPGARDQARRSSVAGSVRPGRPGLAGTADRASSGVAGPSAPAAVWRSGTLRAPAHVCGSGRLSRHRVDGGRGLRPPHDKRGAVVELPCALIDVGAAVAARWLVPAKRTEPHFSVFYGCTWVSPRVLARTGSTGPGLWARQAKPAAGSRHLTSSNRPSSPVHARSTSPRFGLTLGDGRQRERQLRIGWTGYAGAVEDERSSKNIALRRREPSRPIGERRRHQQLRHRRPHEWLRSLALRKQRSRGQVDRRSRDRGADPPRTPNFQPELVERFVQLTVTGGAGLPGARQRIARGDRQRSSSRALTRESRGTETATPDCSSPRRADEAPRWEPTPLARSVSRRLGLLCRGSLRAIHLARASAGADHTHADTVPVSATA